MDDLFRGLRDAGCSPKAAEAICGLYEARQLEAMIRALRRHRRGLMDHLHTCQERVDCLDFLVVSLEKEQKSAAAKRQERTVG